jgi:hypothetical protein
MMYDILVVRQFLLTPAYIPFIRAGEIWLLIRAGQWIESPSVVKLPLTEFGSNQADQGFFGVGETVHS